MKWFLLPLFMFSAASASAEVPLSRSLVSGNALINPESVQKIVKELIVQNLKKNYLAESKFGGLSVQTEATEYHLQIPEKAILKDIMSTLGVANQIQVLIDPIQTSINFGPDSFEIKIENVGTNLFVIRAHWEVNEILAESKSLNIVVPKGVFNRSFVISSSPVRIGLKPGMGPITANLELTANLTNEGSKITLNKFDTNLSDDQSRLHAQLGKLTIDGKPLELEIMSNGRSIKTNEPTIRAQFQNFEPELMKNVQKQLGAIIQKQFTGMSDKLNKQDPFKVSFNSSELLEQYSVKNAALNSLLKDIRSTFVFSYIQELPAQRLFTTQISSQLCVGVDCLSNTWGTTKLSTIDTQSMTGSDVGVILYESWVQNLINSAPFQKRVTQYYNTNLKSPGVALGKDGIKIHFSAEKNAIVAVLNLMIDIKQTTTPKSALDSWGSFWKYQKNQLADVWETLSGSGVYVLIPVEVTIKIKGVQNDAHGKKVLALETEIPFHQDGTITNTYGYPSNVADMNSVVRKELLDSVQKEIGKSLPAKLELPLDDGINVEGIKFNINQVLITPNKGLLVSGCLND